MNPSRPGTHTVYINLDLLFDFYSTLFSAYRTYFVKHSTCIDNFKKCIEGKSLDEGLASLVQEVSQELDINLVKQELRPLLEVSLRCIKPSIGTYTLVKGLSKAGVIIKTFTNFEAYVVDIVKELHKDWFNYEIIQINNIRDMKDTLNYANKETTLFINSSVAYCLDIKAENIPTIFVPHSKRALESLSKDELLKQTLDNAGIATFETLEDIDWNKFGFQSVIEWPTPSYFLKLDEKPANLEYQVWKNVHKMEEPIELTSNIVHGFGRGGKKLGIPTANLDMTPEIEEKLVNLVSGVYYGWAEFLPQSQAEKDGNLEYHTRIPMVMSIGFNPYFNNKYKTAEAHIMRKFQSDFYNSTLKVSIHGLIRTEADFMKFSHLVEAIHNDVQVVKDILSENPL